MSAVDVVAVPARHADPAKFTLSYRPEIDGLRAVAVFVVVLFHVKLGFPGGYVGVDVFFVISGFLITSLILRDVEFSQFRALDFWERRIRRIVPALLATVLVSFIVAWFFYMPDDFDRLGSAAMAQSVFGSNIFHMRASAYFGPGAETLPLLHTWSLAVEEQFYLFFPLALIIIRAWRPFWLPRAIFLGCAISFAVGVWATPRYCAAAFYLLPSRAWELLLGSLLAAYPLWGKDAPIWAREMVGLCGLTAIGISVAIFDSGTLFPGVPALLPCFGASAFLWANGRKLTKVGRVLSWRPFVFIGRVSYSFYLFHCPLLVFSLYWFRQELPLRVKIGLIAAAFILSVISWLTVETPIRKKRILRGRRTLFSMTAGSMLLLLLCGYIVRYNHGFPSRFDAQTLKYAATLSRFDRRFLNESNLQTIAKGNFTVIGAPEGPLKCLVWGDSHAMMMMPAFDCLFRKRGIRGLGATHSGMAPLLVFISQSKFGLKEKAPEMNAAVVKYAMEQRVQTIIMIGNWADYAGDRSNKFEGCLAYTLSTLRSAGMKVVIVRDVPRQQGDVPWLLTKASMLGHNVQAVGISLEEHRRNNSKADEVFARLAGPDVIILDPTPYFMDESGLLRAEFGGQAMYSDAHHLTFEGALRILPLLEEISILPESIRTGDSHKQ